MSTRTPKQTLPTRRARREAARLETSRGDSRSSTRSRSSSRSPILWITAAAILVGVVVIAALAFLNQPTEAISLRPPTDPTPIGLADGRALGRADAPATLDVWADYQCPGCGILARSTEPRLVRDYVADGRLRIVYRDFAFLGPESIAAAAASRAAGEQGAFWPYHDWLYANQNGENTGGFRREVLVAIARELGLDVARFERDLDAQASIDAVNAETGSASTIPVKLTPTLVLNGEVIEGVPAWDELAAKVDAAAGGGTSSGSPTP